MSAELRLREATGLNLAPAIVARAVKARMAGLGLHRPDDYLGLLAGAELQALIELVVVPESWMFRDPEAFAAATAFVRERLRRGRPQRILSIPCAGGEEPYSMAMALRDAGVADSAYGIDALDLSAAAIARAIAGRYTRNAFRGRELGFRERYFTREGEDYRIDDALRRQVNFRQGNLLAFDVSASAGHYDVIFCRNLLIYFDEPTAAAAIANLSTLLADDGRLFAGYAEVPSFCQHGFTPVRAPGAFALQKQGPSAAKTAETGDRPPFRSTSAAKLDNRPSFRRHPELKTGNAPGFRGNGGLSPVSAVSAPARQAVPPTSDNAARLAQARKQADAGEYRAAAASCHAALAASPDSAEAYFILGMVSECENKLGVADDCWRRCVYLQPDHYEALCHLALLSEQLGNASQAAAFKRRAARIYQRREADEGSRP